MSYVCVESKRILIDRKLDIILYDKRILYNIIRMKEIELIMEFLSFVKSSIILDYGCGTGWLTHLLYKKRFRVIGIDKDAQLLKTVKKESCFPLEFVICDAYHLPFKNNIFDSVIGVGILHHLNLPKSLLEVKRVGNRFLFLEPNKLNFLSHIGRVFFPTETHTTTEEPIIPLHLKMSLKNVGIFIEKEKKIFLIVFPLARLLKLLRTKSPVFVIKVIFVFESLAERVPLVKQLNSTIVIQGRK